MKVPTEKRAALLQEMCQHAFQSPWAAYNGTTRKVPTIKECQEVIDRQGYIDYFYDYAIKTDFERKEIDFRLYDRDAGFGKGEQCAQKILGS